MLDRATLVRACEVSLDRLGRTRVNPFSVQVVKSKFLSLIRRFAYSLGVVEEKPREMETTLYAPTLSILTYAMLICWGQMYVIFWALATWIFGSLVLFLLFRLLGSSHDFINIAANVSYSTLPLTLLEPLMTLTEVPLPGLSFIIKCIAVLWASRSASVILVQQNTEKKVFLFEYPLILFNIYLLSLRSGA